MTTMPPSPEFARLAAEYVAAQRAQTEAERLANRFQHAAKVAAERTEEAEDAIFDVMHAGHEWERKVEIGGVMHRVYRTKVNPLVVYVEPLTPTPEGA